MHNVPLVEQAHHQLQRMVRDGRLRPGQRLRELELAEELGVSRTPMREAIRRLVADGLADHQPNRGVVLRRLTRGELVQLADLRAQIESHAAAEAARYASDEQIAELREAALAFRAVAEEVRRHGIESPSRYIYQRHLEVDLAFHEMLHRSTNNRWLQRMVAGLDLLARQGEQFDTHDPSLGSLLWVMSRAYKRHYRTYRAIRRREPETARHELGQIIADANRELLARFDREHGDGGYKQATGTRGVHEKPG